MTACIFGSLIMSKLCEIQGKRVLAVIWTVIAMGGLVIFTATEMA